MKLRYGRYLRYLFSLTNYQMEMRNTNYYYINSLIAIVSYQCFDQALFDRSAEVLNKIDCKNQ